MEIVVVGCGKVGKTLVEHLAIEGHNVVVIDINQKNVEEILTMLWAYAEMELYTTSN